MFLSDPVLTVRFKISLKSIVFAVFIDHSYNTVKKSDPNSTPEIDQIPVQVFFIRSDLDPNPVFS